MRIHGDDGAVLAFERLLGGELEVEIDGELQVLSGDGKRLAAQAHLRAVGVHVVVARTVLAAQDRVVGGLDAGLADDIAGIVGRVARIVFEHVLGDFADIADQVRGEAVARVKAALLFERFELG